MMILMTLYHKQNKQIFIHNHTLQLMNKQKDINKFWNNFKKYYEYFIHLFLILNYFTHFLIFFNIVFKILYFNPVIITIFSLLYYLMIFYQEYEVYDDVFIFQFLLIFYFLYKPSLTSYSLLLFIFQFLEKDNQFNFNLYKYFIINFNIIKFIDLITEKIILLDHKF